LSGRGLCDELITRPEESYRLCCVVVCDLETSRMGAPYIYDISSLKVKGPLRYSAKYQRSQWIFPNIKKSPYVTLNFNIPTKIRETPNYVLKFRNRWSRLQIF